MMLSVSQRRLFNIIALLLILALSLVACERPFPRSTDESETPVAEVSPATDENTASDTTSPQVEEQTGQETSGQETSGQEPSGQETSTGEQTTGYPSPTTDSEVGGGQEETPRIEPEEGATPVPESAGAADETTAEPATDTGEAQPAAEETQPESSTEETPTVGAQIPETHTVAEGENLYRIGLKYGISWVTLAEYNKLTNPNSIKIGQVLKLPQPAAVETAPEPTPSPLTETTYTVKSGDNLFRIGLQYGISWIQIAEANGLVNPNRITVGQVIKIPVNAPGPTPQFTHTVKAGETLFRISLQYGVPWMTIAEANELTSPYVIYVGQTLIIPGS